jgi:hypothetical protein
MKRFGEGSREWWAQVISGMKKMDAECRRANQGLHGWRVGIFSMITQKRADTGLAQAYEISKTRDDI